MLASRWKRPQPSPWWPLLRGVLMGWHVPAPLDVLAVSGPKSSLLRVTPARDAPRSRPATVERLVLSPGPLTC